MALSYEQLLAVAKQGFSTRRLELEDLVHNLKNTEQGNPSMSHGTTSTHSTDPNFCMCGYCREMPTDKERVCCKQRRLCTSRTNAFNNICIESENLSTAIRNMADTYVFTPVYDNRAMRHAAYRQFVMWHHGYLGRGNRRVIPSCCVWQIRKAYPSPNGQYSGYKDSR